MEESKPTEKEILVTYEFEPPPEENTEEFQLFKDTLEKANIFKRIEEKIGLTPTQSKIKIIHTNESTWEGVDTIGVDYTRGNRAVSSLTHEALHLLLRQNNWTEHNEVTKLIELYPELESNPRGKGYKIEQMFAYLLQNEIYSEVASDFNIDTTTDRWGESFFERVLDREYTTNNLKSIGETIIQVWNMPDRGSDIFLMINKVTKILKNTAAPFTSTP
jgi:hypothetical protein